MEFEKFAEAYGVPVAKLQEKELKRLKRRVKNKISAQESRRRKKEYIDSLEQRVRVSDQENGQLRQKIVHMETKMRSLMDEMFVLKQTITQKSCHLKDSNLTKTKTVTRATQTGVCLQCYYQGVPSYYSKAVLESERKKFPYDTGGRNVTVINEDHGVASTHMMQGSTVNHELPESFRSHVQEKHSETQLALNGNKAVDPMEICENKEKYAQKSTPLKDFDNDPCVVYRSENVILIKDPVLHSSKHIKSQAAITNSQSRAKTVFSGYIQSDSKCDGYYKCKRRYDPVQSTHCNSSIDGEGYKNIVSMDAEVKQGSHSPRYHGNGSCHERSDNKLMGHLKQLPRPKSSALESHRKEVESIDYGRTRCFSHPSCSTRNDCIEQSET